MTFHKESYQNFNIYEIIYRNCTEPMENNESLLMLLRQIVRILRSVTARQK